MEVSTVLHALLNTSLGVFLSLFSDNNNNDDNNNDKIDNNDTIDNNSDNSNNGKSASRDRNVSFNFLLHTISRWRKWATRKHNHIWRTRAGSTTTVFDHVTVKSKNVSRPLTTMLTSLFFPQSNSGFMDTCQTDTFRRTPSLR